MTTDYIYRINIIITLADSDDFNRIWTLLGPEGNSEIDTFGVDLSSNGIAPATHKGISTAATEFMHSHIIGSFAQELASMIMSVQEYALNDWDSFLTSNNLKVIQPEAIDG
ncbi:MAG: hypothetical protein KAJ07_04590 [Planctomycetes bacterium]|nr:hypothetical protein [Planctomycetota bacterium]